MDELQIQRINELARKSKAEGLTTAEKEEQASLRREYIEAIRMNLRGQLNNIDVKEKEDVYKRQDKDCICHTINGKPIKPKTLGQKQYVDAIREKMIVFGIGPAGTGKTYLAMAMGIQAFKNDEVSRIILTRPAIEAGEKLGFLPGDLQSKVDPYLRPLYDALYQIMGPENYLKNMEKGLIEVAPLALLSLIHIYAGKELIMKRRMRQIICLTAAAAILGAGAAGCQKSSGDKIVVGSKGFTENLILSELYALALEDAGFAVDRKFEISNAVIHTSIVNGEIDVYPEYTGTALLTILGEEDVYKRQVFGGLLWHMVFYQK